MDFIWGNEAKNEVFDFVVEVLDHLEHLEQENTNQLYEETVDLQNFNITSNSTQNETSTR